MLDQLSPFTKNVAWDVVILERVKVLRCINIRAVVKCQRDGSWHGATFDDCSERNRGACRYGKRTALAEGVRGAGFGPVPAHGAIPPPDSVPRAGTGTERAREPQWLRSMSLYMSPIGRSEKYLSFKVAIGGGANRGLSFPSNKCDLDCIATMADMMTAPYQMRRKVNRHEGDISAV